MLIAKCLLLYVLNLLLLTGVNICSSYKISSLANNRDVSDQQISNTEMVNSFISEVNNAAIMATQSIESATASTQEAFAASEELFSSVNSLDSLAKEMKEIVQKI